MAFAQAKLEVMFAGPPVASEAEAIDVLASGFLDFFLDSTVAGIAALPGPLAAADVAFRAAAVGLSQGGLSASRLQTAITDFWIAALAAAPTVWVTAPALTPGTGVLPVGLPGIAASLTAVFAANLAAEADLPTASAAAAAAIFGSQAGATNNWKGTPTPVL